CSFSEPAWNPCSYNKANPEGIGFDRTATGSNAAAQYAPPVAACFAELQCVPDKYLLWFHHVPWTYRLRGGGTLWDSLIQHYDLGIAQIHANRREWAKLRLYIDPQRFAAVGADLD